MPDMRDYTVVDNGVRPPWWRTVLLIVAVAVCDLFPLVFSPLTSTMQTTHSGSAALLFGLCLLLVLTLPVALVWRQRFPFRITLGAAAIPLVLPVGSMLALVSLASLIGRRRGPAVWWTAAAVAASTSAVYVADSLAQPRGASHIKMWLADQRIPSAAEVSLGGAEVLVALALSVGLAIGAGLLVRSRREAASARQDVQTERAASDRLGDEAARRQERERIAREVHDAMGHRLSLLNLHAGALEANAAGDERVAQSAHVVRESAAAAMDDLRSLLALLRNPTTEDDLPPVTLEHLAGMVKESFGTGQPLSSSILVQDPNRASPALSRAVYRIVQELLTNARKHAPTQPAFLTVDGGPATGIAIDCRNAYVGGWGQGAAGEARGLAGVTERTELLGGTVRYGLDEGGRTFRVHVDLPWSDA